MKSNKFIIKTYFTVYPVIDSSYIDIFSINLIKFKIICLGQLYEFIYLGEGERE